MSRHQNIASVVKRHRKSNVTPSHLHCRAITVAPLFGPTRLASPNWIRVTRLIIFIFIFFQKCRDPNPRSDLTRMTNSNRSPVYSDRFHLSYQKHFIYVISFSSFQLRGSISHGTPTNIYFYTIRLQNGVSCLYKMIYKIIVQRLTLLFTKCHTFKKNGMLMMGYILIYCHFLYDSALLDLAFFPVYSKPVHR